MRLRRAVRLVSRLLRISVTTFVISYGVATSLLAQVVQSRPLNSQEKDHIERLAESLPRYSQQRKFLEGGVHGSGEDKPYMDAMKAKGVKRALVGIRANWVGGRPTDLNIVSHMYFGEYDSSASRIGDEKKLMAFERGGLEQILDQVALERAKSGRSVGDGTKLEGKSIYEQVEFFDDPWMWEAPVSPWDDSSLSPLLHAAMLGDLLEVRRLLREKEYVLGDLNRALLQSIRNYSDNSELIKLLLQAGADVNTHSHPDGSTPLILAVHRPGYIPMLLDAGAKPDETDSWHRTPLRIAKESGETDSVEILTKAGAH
jgi:Ankyrin repeats (3 copies)